MVKLTLEHIELIKILANSDSIFLQNEMNDNIKKNIDECLGDVLRQYYHENTRMEKYEWSREFENAGISIEDGKAAIATARRLGIDIS